jgi:hypothetical protein
VEVAADRSLTGANETKAPLAKTIAQVASASTSYDGKLHSAQKIMQRPR